MTASGARVSQRDLTTRLISSTSVEAFYKWRNRMSRSRPILVLLLACVAQFMLLVDDTITNVALPTIGRDLNFSVANLSWVVNAYLLTFGGFLLVGGRLADRFGPRRVFAASLVGFATASAVCGAAPTAGVLVGARAMQG